MRFIWLSRGDLKGEPENEIIAAQYRHYKLNVMQQKYYKQKQTAIADSVNSLMRQCNTSHQYAHYCKRTVHKET